MKKRILILSALLPLYTSAHSLHLTAQQQGVQLQGDAYYSDMKPAAEHYVGVFKIDDKHTPIMESMTDKNGHIALTLPSPAKHILVVEGMEGHKVSLEVPLLAAADNMNAISQSEFQQLRKDIAQLQEKIYWRDILGGIGYIFGLFGAAVLWRQRNNCKAD